MVDRASVVEVLQEFSDRERQLRLWLSNGDDEVSSFTEALERLFTDTGLGDALEQGQTGLGAAAEESLADLRVVLRTVDRRMPPDLLIDTPQMEAVREVAARALALVDVSEAS